MATPARTDPEAPRALWASRPLRWTAVGLAAVLVVLVAIQLLLPPLVERRVRGRLDDVAEVRSVEVDAFPAVQLLWRHADRLEVELGDTQAGSGKLADLLEDTERIGDVRGSATRLRIGALDLRDTRLRKDSKRLSAEARVTSTGISAAFVRLDVKPVAVRGGRLVVEGRASVAGAGVTMRGRVVAEDGAIIVRPEGVPLVGGLLSYTVFDDPRVPVDAVGARRSRGGFVLTARGRLR